MTNIYNYTAHAVWGGNHKKPKQIGAEFLRMVDALTAIYPVPPDCTKSYWTLLDESEDEEADLLTKYSDNMTKYVKDNICRDEDDIPDPDGGYWIFSQLMLEPLSASGRSSLSFNLQDGSPFKNDFEFELGASVSPPDPDRVTFPFYKAALLAGLSIWPADWANVRCSQFGASPAEASLDPHFPYSGFQMPWMSYLSAERAVGVSVPAGIVTERTPDGGLLMIAAESRLDPDDPYHMARSRSLAELMIKHVGNH